MKVVPVFNEDDQAPEPRPITLLDFATEGIGRPGSCVSINTESMKLLCRCMDRDRRDFRMFRAVIGDFALEESDFYPADGPWVLRNMTTREYVRCDVLAPWPHGVSGPHIGHPGFGEVVISHICWSSTPVADTVIHRGPWAGHWFEITTWTRHATRAAPDTQWSDVSAKIKAEVLLWQRRCQHASASLSVVNRQ